MTEPNPYDPPVSNPNADPKTQGQALYQAYRGRARTIRLVSVLLLLFSLFFLGAGLNLLMEGLRSWSQANSDLRIYQYPERVAAGYREHAFLGLGFALPCLLLSIINSAITVGLWRFQGWPRRVTGVQGYIVLVLGSLFACYYMYLYRGDTGAVPAIFPGLILVLLSAFIRSRRSVVVCSQAFRDARAEMRGTRQRSPLEHPGS
jgi:hypothetical protein